MKCTEYLWKKFELDATLPKDVSPEEVDAKLRELTGGEEIVSDTTGKTMSIAQANSIAGRIYYPLVVKFRDGSREKFEAAVVAQLKADDEYEAKKGEQ